MEHLVRELSELVTASRHTVVLTGAGMDTESSIPDFRGKNGLWRNQDPRVLASIDTFDTNYPLFQAFYAHRYKLLETCQPHRGHYILAEMEAKGLVKAVATQNVSRLHLVAGSQRVFELHGNIRTFRCHYCNRPAGAEDFLAKKPCRHCGKQGLRPNVVLFGESLPMDAWEQAVAEIRQSDLLLVIGTSLAVAPVNQLPRLARGKTVYLNDDITVQGYDFDLTIEGKAGEVLETLWGSLHG
ncbi:MAG TPA: NAD-dependent deacylase [Clostridia bacterium]|nr:NAD-dependent deacylase [Clostridia bacterium]